LKIQVRRWKCIRIDLTEEASYAYIKTDAESDEYQAIASLREAEEEEEEEEEEQEQD